MVSFLKGGKGGFEEFDGGQDCTAEEKEKDRVRDDYMIGAGITVVRFSDREVLRNPDSVLEEIWRQL